MEDKTAQTDNNYYANLNRIVRFFTRTTSGYAFASIDNQHHINAINNQLSVLLHERHLNVLFFNFDTQGRLNLVEQLQLAGKPGIDALIVNNLGVLAEIKDGILTEKGSNAIQEFNFAREALFNLRTPILFWASKNLLSIISNRAADLYTQRSINSVFFDHYPDEAQPEIDLESRFLPEYRTTRDYETLELKIKLLKKQLADAEAFNYPISKIASQLALPLAKTYS